MTSERVAGIRVNMNTASEQELRTMLGHAAARVEEAKIDAMIIDDYLQRRFGTVAISVPSLPYINDQVACDIAESTTSNVLYMADYWPTERASNKPTIA